MFLYVIHGAIGGYVTDLVHVLFEVQVCKIFHDAILGYVLDII